MKKLLSVLGTIIVVVGLFSVGFLKAWNVFVQENLGGPCRTRYGCLSFSCLEHASQNGAETKVHGYCTIPCKDDSACAKQPDMRCVVPSQAALDDLAKLGRPDKLCMRVK